VLPPHTYILEVGPEVEVPARREPVLVCAPVFVVVVGSLSLHRLAFALCLAWKVKVEPVARFPLPLLLPGLVFPMPFE
jgi:hypothetical protein